jgi:hypothetical protein
MSVLKSLKLANAVPVRATTDPVQRTRDKVITALAEQKAMAAAKIAGERYAPTQTVWRKNEAGERVQMEKLKRLRPGWFTDAAGKTFFALRYAGKPMELAKDKNAVDVGEFANLPAVIDQLIVAVQAGELDAQLAAAANARGEQLRKAKA